MELNETSLSHLGRLDGGIGRQVSVSCMVSSLHSLDLPGGLNLLDHALCDLCGWELGGGSEETLKGYGGLVGVALLGLVHDTGLIGACLLHLRECGLHALLE